MPPLKDITDIVDRIGYWITKSDSKVPQKIAAAYKQKGGWEGWAQVEIAYIVQIQYKNVTIDREVNVYEGTKQENDFVITDKNDASKPKQIVELKCERGTQKPEEFRKEFQGDIDKINKAQISDDCIPATAYAVAISCTAASYKLLFETEWRSNKVSRTEGTAGIWIWFYERDII